MSGVDVLAVIRDAVKVFETPGFRLLVDHSEFAVEAGTLHQHLMASYVAVAELIEASQRHLSSTYSMTDTWNDLRAALANVGSQP